MFNSEGEGWTNFVSQFWVSAHDCFSGNPIIRKGNEKLFFKFFVFVYGCFRRNSYPDLYYFPFPSKMIVIRKNKRRVKRMLGNWVNHLANGSLNCSPFKPKPAPVKVKLIVHVFLYYLYECMFSFPCSVPPYWQLNYNYLTGACINGYGGVQLG